MKEKIKKIILVAVVGILIIPTVALGGSFTISLIQGKTAEEAVQILAHQIDRLIKRVLVLEKRVDCLELIRHTPDRGPGQWINIDITGFYQSSLEKLEEWRNNPSRPEEQQAEIDFWQELIDEAKPLYDNYIEKCGVEK